MSKILFTHSYFYRFDPKQWKAKQPYPPLGTLYGAAYLRSKGYEVSLFDTNLKKSPDEIVRVLNEENPKYLVIYDDGFNYLTKMCLTNMREAAFRLTELGKKAGCKVILSSSDSTDHYGIYLANGADYVILGEAEVTLCKLINNLEDGNNDLQNVLGLVYISNQKEINTGRRDILKELDSIPMPAWDLVDINSYKNIWLENHGFFSLNIATTRGCPFKCNWCAKPIYGNRYNTRSPENVVEEIMQLINNYSVDHFWVCDDIFGLKPGWVQRFRNLVRDKSLKFTYKIQSRVDLLLEEDTIDALAESGAETVWVGAESGSQKILDAMDKGTTVEQIHSATKLLRSKGIKTAFFLQFGYPGEQKEDIQKTIDMVLELLPDDIGISVSYPLPGTVFYEKVKDELKTKANWTDSDDLAVMFRSTYPPEFYKKLHRYVHKVYRKKQGINTIKNLFRKPTTINKRKLRSALLTFYYIPTSIIDSIKLKRLENTS
ncbi:MAG: B12-binding domain-containing radical SAM protein [Ignavibacteria bacterium]|nr:MAG: B12-binding domain-containing radical SAM protein [Ignavibacteria bacterium]